MKVEVPIWFPDNHWLPSDVLFAVTTRQGGRSHPPFDSLNLSYSAGDAPKNVALNRRRVACALRFDADRIVAAQQVHADGVAIVNEEDAGKGSRDFERAIAATDALVTVERRLPLTVYIADCAPVFLFDSKEEVIALAHVGWRGAVAGVLLRTVEQMMWRFDSRPQNLVAIVGPHIDACCYEVGAEVADQFRATFVGAVYDRDRAKQHVSLAKAIHYDLLTCGVEGKRICLDAPCTKCNPNLFFSHRGSGGRTGRMMAVAMLK